MLAVEQMRGVEMNSLQASEQVHSATRKCYERLVQC